MSRYLIPNPLTVVLVVEFYAWCFNVFYERVYRYALLLQQRGSPKHQRLSSFGRFESHDDAVIDYRHLTSTLPLKNFAHEHLLPADDDPRVTQNLQQLLQPPDMNATGASALTVSATGFDRSYTPVVSKPSLQPLPVPCYM